MSKPKYVVAWLLIMLLVPAIGHAQSPSLSDILELIRKDSRDLDQENSRRLAEFKQKRNQQQSMLRALKKEVATLDKKGKQLSAEYDRNEIKLGELQEQLVIEAGDFAEILGQFRTTAGEIEPILRRSIISQHYGGRSDQLANTAQARVMPSRGQLDFLWKAILQESVGQTEVTSFNAKVANMNGGEPVKLIRIGPFSVFTASDNPEFVEIIQGSLSRLGRQPSRRIIAGAAKLVAAGEGEIVPAPIDPSRGDLLGLLANTPGFADRVKQGGAPGYVVLLLLLVGLGIGLGKLVTLSLTAISIRKSTVTRHGGNANALERIFRTYEQCGHDNLETLELRLDEAIMKEIPSIERGINIVKVLAAVAPLLGLLGTVVGMIRTFTQITLVGTGDPKTMADGISQALVTTVEGLIAAIPLILLHAIISGRASYIRQILEEQAAGMIAEHAERDKTPT